MDNINQNLGHYYDQLEEAFPSSQLTDRARNVAIHGFVEYVQSNRLSIDVAITILKDPKLVEQFVAIGNKAEELHQAESGGDPKSGADPLSVAAILHEDVKFIKDIVVNFIEVGQRTNEILVNVEKAAQEANSNAADNTKMLGEVHVVAGELKQNLTSAIDTTKDIVRRLEPITAHLDTQLQKMEALETGAAETAQNIKAAGKDIKQVADNTDPPKTRKENIKMMIWGTIASTVCGAAVGAAITHYSGHSKKGQQPDPPQIEKIVERVSTPPTTYTLKDRRSGRVYTLEVNPAEPAKTPQAHHHKKKKPHVPRKHPRHGPIPTATPAH